VTTIAYRDGVLAADSLFTKDGIVHGTGRKIFDLGDGRLLAIMGYGPHAYRLKTWIEAGCGGDQPPGDAGAAVLFEPDGRIRIFENGGEQPECDAAFHAYGSGEQIAMGAMGAMAAGASAERAVQVATALCTQTGGEVHTLKRKLS
jgi:ATP-dependent HslUV protease subunit HslV